jgi:hypothetical protein
MKKILSKMFVYLTLLVLGVVLFKFMSSVRDEKILFGGIGLFFTLNVFGSLLLFFSDVFRVNQYDESAPSKLVSAGVQYNITKAQAKIIGLSSVLAIALYAFLLSGVTVSSFNIFL